MSPRRRFITQSDQGSTRGYIERTSIITITVSSYSSLKSLPGAYQDTRMVKEIFSENPTISLYPTRFKSVFNPNANLFRKTILDYATSRSARGDILILYYSGHGVIVGTNDFAFCPKDASFGIDESKILPLSVISFREVVQTLSAVDVFPVFIIDSCFSGATAAQGTLSLTEQMHDLMHSYFSGSYALLASTSLETLSFESQFGGFFTRSFHSIVMRGLGDNEGKHTPFLTLDVLSAPLQEQLAKDGQPLSKCYIGPYLPPIAIAKNIKYSPDTEKFTPYFKRIIEYAWNNGNPRIITTDDLLNIGTGAYANHSKLSLTPWNLLDDGKDNSTRVLSERGIQFAKGELAIPETIIRDAVTWNWITAPDTRQITIKDIKVKQVAQRPLGMT